MAAQRDAVVAVGAGQERGERGAAPVDHNVALRARAAAIRRVRAGLLAPLFAGTQALSRQRAIPVDPVGGPEPLQEGPV